MRRFRHLALFLVLFYAVFAAGVTLHSHAGKDPVSPDCKLCQVSHVSLIQTPETHCSPQISDLGTHVEPAAVAILQHTARISLGRAPPTA